MDTASMIVVGLGIALVLSIGIFAVVQNSKKTKNKLAAKSEPKTKRKRK